MADDTPAKAESLIRWQAFVSDPTTERAWLHIESRRRALGLTELEPGDIGGEGGA